MDEKLLNEKFKNLENKIKERENNLFRAIKTFVVDIAEFQKDPSKGFPNGSLLGLIFAFFKRRMILVVGGLFAVAFSACRFG